MSISIIPVKVTQISDTTQEFSVTDVITGTLLKTPERQIKVMLDSEYRLGIYESLGEAMDAITDIYILLADIETRHYVNELKGCLKKYIGLDLKYIL
ncbi:hypothetical protein [Pantoea coffeiphila]|uniref:hypothetical protein n=1 Tax=Pantoea coffeiphila TaxID=1465635 RepID=UPI0011B053EC|nr:hypothetical protein [Pantoea coffeiphila]